MDRPGLADAGRYDFTFEFDAQWPGIYLYPGVQTGFVAVPTTVVPMTLTVLPAPASAVTLVVSIAMVFSRRRRG